ncbi:hypothetical protein KY290_010675 [Solanum tuberosum]|uniref:Putative plant transposon protein domain-containing protein n=1 Tax=Solanum tuberosum TaxID=4113 RepID=A0ABQ7VYH4_SOLTU|nr:hypothetical protein KY290_010675 [Solanum tuberosum]
MTPKVEEEEYYDESSNDHIKAYHILGAEFYTDSLEMDFGGEVVITISGVQVHFGLAIINALYRLQDVDDEGLTNQYWLSIFCAQIIPSTHDTKVTLARIVCIASIMDGIGINTGRLIMDQIVELAQGRAKCIIFTSHITRLCYDGGVVKCTTDEEKKLRKEIHPLNKKGR